jgi:SpoVK/Ycf46/Vps4 family AAA+-type ATPase
LGALAQASEGFSGAEIEQAVVSALYTAFSRDTDVDTSLLIDELKATTPLSVTREEDITALRAWARGRTVMAN